MRSNRQCIVKGLLRNRTREIVPYTVFNIHHTRTDFLKFTVTRPKGCIVNSLRLADKTHLKKLLRYFFGYSFQIAEASVYYLFIFRHKGSDAAACFYKPLST